MDAVITIDVERLYPGAEKGTYQFLSLLHNSGIKGTFFITGDVISNCPEIVNQIVKAGHEIASHGFSHPGYPDNFQLPYLMDLSLDEAREEIRRSKQIFGQYGYNARGFRAPGFRIKKEFLNIVGQYFEYDSSIVNSFFPGDKYKRLPRVPSKIGNVLEIPVSNLNFCRIPLGTPYFLTLGSVWLIKLLKWLGTTNPIILYFHCFDLVGLNNQALPHSRFKKKWYFEKCGPENIYFFESLFSFLLERGISFRTCQEISEDLKEA